MALSDVDVQLVINSAIGRIGRAGGGGSDVEIARQISERLGRTDPSESFAILNHVRTARRLMGWGDDIEGAADPNTPVEPGTRDRSYDGQGRGYYYRVAVVVFDPDSMTSYSRMTTVFSGPAMTAAELHDAALSQVQTDPSRSGRYLDGFGVTASTTVTIRVITGGRT